MEPKHHDLVLAITSHVPHLIAYNIVGTAADLETVTQSEVIKYSASGFRDFTRIAASDPTMWRDIFLNNREAVLEMLGRFNEDLAALQRAVRWGDGDALFNLFTRTRAIRRSIVQAGQDTAAPNFGRSTARGRGRLELKPASISPLRKRSEIGTCMFIPSSFSCPPASAPISAPASIAPCSSPFRRWASSTPSSPISSVLMPAHSSVEPLDRDLAAALPPLFERVRETAGSPLDHLGRGPLQDLAAQIGQRQRAAKPRLVAVPDHRVLDFQRDVDRVVGTRQQMELRARRRKCALLIGLGARVLRFHVPHIEVETREPPVVDDDARARQRRRDIGDARGGCPGSANDCSPATSRT